MIALGPRPSKNAEKGYANARKNISTKSETND